MTVYDWPATLTRFQAIAFNPRGMTVSGPPSLLGRTQVGSLDAGYWVAGIFGIAAHTPATIRAFRALRAQLEGGAHHVRVPVCDTLQAPASVSPPIETDGVTAARTTLMGVSDITGLEAGVYFSPGTTDRLYLIREVIESPLGIVIWPPAREEIASGVELNFAAPVCRMRPVDESSGDLTLEFFKRGFPDMAFVEVF